MTPVIASMIIIMSLALFLRGGAMHNYLVAQAEGVFRAAGYDTIQEHPLVDSMHGDPDG